MCYPYVTRMSLVYTRVSFVCHSYVLVCHLYVLLCHPYVTRMYSYGILMSFICIRVSSICHSYVLVCHPYVTRIHPYVTRMCSNVIRMSLVCGFTMNRSGSPLFCSIILKCMLNNVLLFTTWLKWVQCTNIFKRSPRLTHTYLYKFVEMILRVSIQCNMAEISNTFNYLKPWK